MQGPSTATLIGAMTTPGDLISAADTSWMLVATALVLLMTPALAFFYGGLVRSKNVLNTMMMSLASIGVVGIVWVVAGYSLAFAPGNGWLGGGAHLLLNGVGLEPKGTIPHLLFMAYQGTFAIITVALISGAVVERMRFGPYLAFLVLWSLLVYAPVAHWVWGEGGWLARLGALDFAGGTVVPVNVGGATGIVVGLVAITPAAGFVSPHSALLIGALAAVPSYFAILMRARTRLDDSLDVTAAHGLGGLVGALATGVLAQKAWGAPAN